MKIISKSLNDTEKIAKAVVDASENEGALICLYGDIGAGKTALTKFVGKHLGIPEKITSPSFVILNEYHSGKAPMYHFDLYRLESEGVLTILDELSEYSEKPGAFTLIEWAEFSNNQLPLERIDVSISYIDDETREFSFSATGEKHQKMLDKMKELLKNVFIDV